MDWKLEVVTVPVSDVDRAKAFYGDTLGFPVDTDFQGGPDFRVVQVTPPGSVSSIVFGKGWAWGARIPGCQLVMPDISAAAEPLRAAGVEFNGPVPFEKAGILPGGAPH